MMVMEYDIFFMFYTTILSVLCYMNTYLATWVVASAYGMFECILLAGVALQITLHVPDAREGVLLQYMYLSMQENEGQVASKVKCVIMSRRQTKQHQKLHSSLERLHTVPLHTYQHNF